MWKFAAYPGAWGVVICGDLQRSLGPGGGDLCGNSQRILGHSLCRLGPSSIKIISSIFPIGFVLQLFTQSSIFLPRAWGSTFGLSSLRVALCGNLQRILGPASVDLCGNLQRILGPGVLNCGNLQRILGPGVK